MQLIEKKIVEGHVHIIKESNHHLHLDNPNEMVYKVLMSVFGQDIAD
jgi:hypothetical protein